MKKRKRILALVVTIITIINCYSLSMFGVHAHNHMLPIEWDDCKPTEDDDGSNEIWYMLSEFGTSDDGVGEAMHIDQNVKEIIYYFEPTSEDGSYSWTSNNVSPTEADEIKTAYENSMKKWNNVYFYSQDSNGNLIKNRVIEIRKFDPEKDEEYNLSIYPDGGNDFAASTYTTVADMTLIETVNVRHYHVSKWKMKVRINFFRDNASGFSNTRARTGAHEIGHILGLNDVDNFCKLLRELTYRPSYDHHQEILMGYGNLGDKATNISYQDIAGVAITRGFHTDSDHKWLSCGQQSDNSYKLLCSICNGVKYVSSLSGYTYDTYNYCNGDHHLGQGNMMAVASYGEADYYKCRYCKYVARFSMIEYQDYSNASYYNTTYHRYTNYVEGLGYRYLEEHNLNSNGYCTECNAHIDHEYGSYTYNGYANHIRNCSCGATQTESHYIRLNDIIDGRYAVCLGCRARLDLNNDTAHILSPINIQYSINGSYLLPSGIAVLADEDMEAYLNGTLRFYNKNDLPVTQ